MQTLHIPPSLDLHYIVDDYTDPWRTPGTILLLHGNAESSAAWYTWVPRLAHRYRVVRPDMRGFGASTPMPREFPWTLDVLIDDFCADVPKIACPTLVITTEGSGLATVDDTRAWQQTIADSELLVLPGDSSHVAASHAAQCAEATLEFIERRDPDN